MAQKLSIIAFVSIPCACIYLLSMRLMPHRGLLRLCEKLFIGISVIYLLNFVLSPFSFTITQNPLASLIVGYLGFPGAVFTFVIQCLL